MRRAVIDIGTNTVKLLVADVADGQIAPVVAGDTATRLGKGVDRTGRLSRTAIERTVAAISEFVAKARQLGATEIRAIATSAAREAANRQEFLAACPLPVEVLTGAREAELIFCGVASDPAFAGQPLLVLDVGGGSAELVQGKNGAVETWQSLPLGAVRLLEQFGDDFAGLTAHVRRTLAPAVTGRAGWPSPPPANQPIPAARRTTAPHQRQTCRFVGTGGAITTLANIVARASWPRDSTPGDGPDARPTGVDHARLTPEDLRAWVSRLNALPLPERKKVPGLPPERADIIVPGGMVFVAAMELLGAPEVTVSVRNLRYGALVS